ncbi:MAG: response regulator [Synergistaceae bacterium]|nr:response regulator [Synergistaceae bacterium]
MDGIETIKHIRGVAGNDIPIIVITAYDFSEIVDRAAEVGVSMFIAKPLFQSSLFNLLANICGRPNTDKIRKSSVAFDGGGARVLLAEDNVMNMEIAKEILESANLVVDCAWNGQEAVEKFEDSRVGTYKAILMDVQMPVMDGHKATRAIRASIHPEGKTIPIIAMTADAFAENVAEAMESGMNDHISKPIDISVLFSTLRKYI